MKRLDQVIGGDAGTGVAIFVSIICGMSVLVFAARALYGFRASLGGQPAFGVMLPKD